MKRHRWIATMVYDLTPEDALRMMGLKPTKGSDRPPTELAGDEAPSPDDERPYLGLHNLDRSLSAVGCYDCEAALTDARLVDTECPGQPPGELTYIDAQGQRTDHRTAAPSAPVSVAAVGRNDPCPCGSGRKWKRCHGDRAR